MKESNYIIAIDGFSSCGKSTVAKALAKELNFAFIDTGAMYRAVTLYFLRNKVDFFDESAVREALTHIKIDFVPNGETTHILLNGEDVSLEIRKMYVSDKVSEVSAIKQVREVMVAQQQELGRRRNVVLDGRDVGTTVFPHADLKIFMTASPEVRAKRRFKELQSKGDISTIEEIRANLAHRDHIDTTREESPLRQAADAIVLDNTNLTPTEQLKFILDRYNKI
ncbi:(d)CMP kinase [Sphingobacterium sp. UT-1RO-CII-1]|nr:(d)CMP kinase [Sphingobacterium sp. UT-1RO-CII-1]MCY4781383.1 (d)CMP kinase [Sphingobacterium sp. UT-1RO-CII-1]